jgi:hypothetical protein
MIIAFAEARNVCDVSSDGNCEMRCVNARKVATPGGFEPLTSWFEAKRSIQLSYGVVWVRIAEAGGKIKRLGWLRHRRRGVEKREA